LSWVERPIQEILASPMNKDLKKYRTPEMTLAQDLKLLDDHEWTGCVANACSKFTCTKKKP